MSKKTILSVAVTGNQTTVQQHPGLPCTPVQIATACIDAARAGAAITHIHVRYEDGRPSMELGHYKEVVDRIRDSGVDASGGCAADGTIALTSLPSSPEDFANTGCSIPRSGLLFFGGGAHPPRRVLVAGRPLEYRNTQSL